MQMQNQEKRVFEVTGGQIWAAVIIAAIALTIVFEVGSYQNATRKGFALQSTHRSTDGTAKS